MQSRRFISLMGKAAGVLFTLFCCGAMPAAAQDDQAINPTTTCYATRGMTQISSAEALGSGRLTVGLQGAWYQQRRNFDGAPDSMANIFTGIGALSFGMNSYIDIFGSIAGFGSTNYTNSTSLKNKAGLGTISCGVQGSLPLPSTSPLRLGMQCVIFAGTSPNQINSNNADGYNYFETRAYYDFMG